MEYKERETVGLARYKKMEKRTKIKIFILGAFTMNRE